MPRRFAKRSRTEVSDRVTLPLFASAMRRLKPADDLARVEDRPQRLPSGLHTLDRVLGGGFPLSEATLVAARPKVGATSLLMGAALAALKRGERVAYFSERLREEQLRGRFVVLESRVNGYRFHAGFVSAEDRIALAAARERIPWSALSVITRRLVTLREIDSHLFSYRPWLVIVDVPLRAPDAVQGRRFSDLYEGAMRMASMARRHHVALLVRLILAKASHPPTRLELPGLGALAEPFATVLLVHREEVTDPHAASERSLGRAEVHAVRLAGRDRETQVAALRFDQRFAGLLDP